MKDNTLEKILSEVANEDDYASSEPYYVISGSGWGFYLDPEVSQMVMIPKGTEIVPIDDNLDEQDRLLCRSPYRFLLIPKFEVQQIGWN